MKSAWYKRVAKLFLRIIKGVRLAISAYICSYRKETRVLLTVSFKLLSLQE